MVNELSELKWLILLLYPIVVLYLTARVIVNARRLKSARVQVLGLTVEVAMGQGEASQATHEQEGNHGN